MNTITTSTHFKGAGFYSLKKDIVQFQTEEGRMILDSLNNTYHYEYFLREHIM